MTRTGFYSANVLLPQNTEMTKWSVVACDQYTSEPQYWEQVRALVGDAPSTLRLTLPEVYLESENVEEHIASINAAMSDYLQTGILHEAGEKYIYVERTLASGTVRKGLMGMVDLEQYNYLPGSQSLIRATEGTVLERIPPRVKVRKNAALELPHVMILIDDSEKTVIEPLAEKISSMKSMENMKNMQPVYDFTLMQNSGSIRGYAIDSDCAKVIDTALEALADQTAFNEKYNVTDKGVLLFAVGDGNHSLATAKECFEQLKKTLPESEWSVHPARYALVELVNLHDSALEFEPIHRVVFDVDPAHLLGELSKLCGTPDSAEVAQTFTCITANETKTLTVANPSSNLTVGSLQAFLDAYTTQYGGKIDYIHGDDVVEKLSKEPGNIGFLLPCMGKDELFPTVILDGVLPRKTFSMGHACDKRFYLECRRICTDLA